ncbi:hypothetical protein [Marinoscillum sp.]|uniref:hypothetical protein n=1 Tax=Marinoscillum sp. TaxID=2024838 RepID=UPI003BAB8247
MGDQLERFIQTNREEFDSELPSENVWRSIHQGQTKAGRWLGLWKVAAVVLLMSTVYLVVERQLDSTSSRDVAIDSEFKQVEQYYTQLISQKKSEISTYGQTNLSREFILEIERLDQLYAQLKQTYARQNSSDLISDMMIKNLQLRIEILNKQVQILKELKNKENETNTSVEI